MTGGNTKPIGAALPIAACALFICVLALLVHLMVWAAGGASFTSALNWFWAIAPLGFLVGALGERHGCWEHKD